MNPMNPGNQPAMPPRFNAAGPMGAAPPHAPAPQGGPMPPPAAAAPGASGAPQPGAPMQVPPQFAQHIDPNNPVQMLLLQRIDRLTPQDGQALETGISPQAAQALKKVIPEVGFLIDMIHGGQGQGGAPQPGMASPPAMPHPAGAPMRGPPLSLPQPATRLGDM